MATPRVNWEAQAEQETIKHRLTDTFEIGKAQYNTSSQVAKTSYEDQLARMRESFRRSSPGFDASQAARGIAGSGFGAQNVLNRAIGQGQQKGTLAKNYLLSQIQLNDQLAGLKKQFETGISDADLARFYKEIAFQQSLV